METNSEAKVTLKPRYFLSESVTYLNAILSNSNIDNYFPGSVTSEQVFL